jgi:hypothetical protein
MKISACFSALVLLAGFATAGELRLKDGTILRGDVVSTTDSTVVLLNPTFGKVTVARSRIVAGLDDSTARAVTRVSRRGTDPAGYALFALPTAFMPPKGAGTFRDFELFFLTLGYSPTSTTSVTAGTLFPLVGSFGVLTLGVKQQLFEIAGTATAVTGNLTLPLEGPDGNIFNANALLGHRFAANGYEDALGVHAGYGFMDGPGEGLLGVYGFGSEVRLGAHAKFIIEYVSAGEFVDGGLLNLGFRLHGERLSADIAGIRSLSAEGTDLLLIPLVIVNYRF